jgi:cyclopropane-fatty-acyl-phospholipid synthase
MRDDRAETRLRLFREIVEEAHRTLGLRFGFRLWDGALVPADWPEDGLRLVLRDEAVVAELVRRPRIDTLVAAHMAGRIDLENGSIFDFAKARPEGRPGRLLRKLSKLKLARTAALFWRAPKRSDSGPLDAVKEEKDARAGTAAVNKRNVSYHYDVSNAFYRLFLDEEMVYTCAYFQPDWHDDLDRAQRDKLDMICRKLRLQPGERLLDIGCGWGALVCHAARHYGVTAVGATLSEEQAALAREKVERLGLSGRVTILVQDFAALEGPFDKVSSIGMFEHVGIDNHGRYFAAVNRVLKPGGLYLHHAISRPAKGDDRSFRKMRAEYRALTRYIFPGGELDHLGMSIANLERAKFEIHDVEGWRRHYARTTRLWWERLNARRGEAEAEVGVEKTRLWLLYLAGCSLAFERGAVGVFQTVAQKRAKGFSPLPPTREDLYRGW